MGRLRERVRSTLNIRENEGVATSLLLIHSFFIGLSLVFFDTAAYALFLSNFQVQYLPYVYILSAVVVSAVGFVYSRYGDRIPLPRLLIGTLVLLFATIGFFYFCLKLVASRWTILSLVVSYNIMEVLVGLEFWALAGHLFNVRQGKRLFGLIATGEISAGIIGGASIPFLLSHGMQTANLLVISAVSMIMCLLVLHYILKRFGAQLSSFREENGKERSKSISELVHDRYILLIFAVASVSILGYYLIDYLYYHQVQEYFVQEAVIASFLGIFSAVLGTVNLISNTFIPGRLINRYGLSVGLLAVPVAVGIGCFAAGASQSIFGAMIAFFWIIAGTKLFDEVLRKSIEDHSFRILYQPLPPGQRIKAQTLLETIVEPLAGALASGLLLLYFSFFDLKAAYLVYVLLAVLLGWALLAGLLRKEYTAVLMNALTKRKLGGKSVIFEDASSRLVLRQGLESNIAGEVIYCLNVLEEMEHEKLNIFLMNLLDHEQHQVREHVLNKIESLGIIEAASAVTERLKEEKVPRVLGTALRTLCALVETEAFDQVYPFLDDPDPELKRGAMVGLLRNGGIDGVLSAGANLNALIDSEDPEDRKFAAQVLGEVGISSYYRPLLKLLNDENREVKRAATIASGRLKNTRLLPHLLDNVAEPVVRDAAISAIIAYGQRAVPELEQAFNQPDQQRETRVRIIQILGKIGGARAAAFLKRKMDFPENKIRHNVLRALVSCNYRAEADEVKMIRKKIFHEVEEFTWILSVLVDFRDYKEAATLVDALRGDLESSRQRIFLLLTMIFPAQSIMQAQTNLVSNSAEKRAYALEALDNILSPDIRDAVFPLLDEVSPNQRHARLINIFPQERMSPHERLISILDRSPQWTSSWTRACAVYTMGRLATANFYEVIVSALTDLNPTVRETAVWALGRINPGDLVERLQPMTTDSSEQVVKFSKFVINSVGFASVATGRGYITRSGRSVTKLFTNMLMDESESRPRRCHAAEILAMTGGQTAFLTLAKALTTDDPVVGATVMEALIEGGFSTRKIGTLILFENVNAETETGKKILSCFLTVKKHPRLRQLADSLKDELYLNWKRSFLLLILMGKKEMNTLLDGLQFWFSNHGKKPIPDFLTDAMARVVKRFHGKIDDKYLAEMLRHIDDMDSVEKSISLPEEFEDSPESLVRQLAFETPSWARSWTRLTALRAVVTLKMTDCYYGILDALKSPSDYIRETAAFAMFQLHPDSFATYSERMKNDPSPKVSGLIKQLESGKQASQSRESKN